jgi:hypothetical protein
MKGQRPPPRNMDAESRRAVQASVARRRRMLPLLASRDTPPADASSLTAPAGPPGPSEPQPQPVPWGWQSTGSDLLRARRRYDPAAYASWSGNQVIVPPTVPPEQPKPVTQVGAQAEPVTLSDIATTGPITQGSPSRIETDYADLLSLAISLEKMARDEITRLSGERPNDPFTIESNKKQSDLLSILADGFAKLAAALVEYSKQPQPFFAGKAKEVVDEFAAQFNTWWKANGAQVIDWGIRLPVIIASTGLLGWAGANMTVATTAVSALVGGPNVITAVKVAKKRTKRP